MRELTYERYLAIGRELGYEESRAAREGRAAYAACFPYAVAVALEEPPETEVDHTFNIAFEAKCISGPQTRRMVRDLFANRLARLTAKPDPAVEAVKAYLNNWKVRGDWAAQIVAAVDEARKGAK